MIPAVPARLAHMWTIWAQRPGDPYAWCWTCMVGPEAEARCLARTRELRAERPATSFIARCPTCDGNGRPLPPPPFDPESEFHPVGEGPEYAEVRARARELVPPFYPGGVGNCTGTFGLGMDATVSSQEEGHMVTVLTWEWEKRGLCHRKPFTLRNLRATAIGLLAYCEAQERENGQHGR